MKLFDQDQEQVKERSKELSEEVEKEAASSPEDLVFSIQPPESADHSVLPEAFTMSSDIPDQDSVSDTAESLKDALIPDTEEPAPEPESDSEEAVSAAEAEKVKAENAEPSKETEIAQPKEEIPTPSVTYASMAEAIEQSGKKVADPTTRRQGRDIDDETLLAEIYALMGETPRKRSDQSAFSTTSIPDVGATPVSDRPAPEAQPAPMPRPAANPNPDAADPAYRSAPIVYGGQDSAPAVRAIDPIELESGGVPGWVKGIFLFLITLLLSGMTFYAIATDLFGKVF